MAAGKEEKKRLASKRVKAHSRRCCLHKLTLVALHGAEGSMSSPCFHLQSFPSLRQFLSCIDVASHYCKVPINPPFIRPCALIHFFSLLTSLTLSCHCCLIPIFSPPFFSIWKEMSSYISVVSL